MGATLRDRAVIGGIGQTEFSKNSGRSELQLAAEAATSAIADAGLSPADIDGLVTFSSDTNDEIALMRNIGVEAATYTARTPFGGGGACAVVQHAAMAVATGVATNVLVYRAFNERSGRRFGQPRDPGDVRDPALNWSLPYGLNTPASMFSLWYQRYMHAFGVTNVDFGRYSVICRRYASTNPNAWFYERPITLDDHQDSRWIVEPVLRLLDCCQESDGGVALVVTSAERAGDLPHGGVRILAATQGHLLGGDVVLNYYQEDLARFTEAALTGIELWRTAGLGPEDMDAAMIYENFSPVVFLQLEALGFCGPGEAKDFIREGNIELGGTLPVNTHGGLLGEAYIHGVNNVHEAVRQLRGTATNQVADARHVAVSAGRSALVLGGPDQ